MNDDDEIWKMLKREQRVELAAILFAYILVGIGSFIIGLGLRIS